jgi:DNA (cytosine-5)-methyltransferase 1
MNHGSLFSGIGGFDLAAEWMGWTNKFHCEWNGFGQQVLKYYWPNALSYEDITKTDFTIWRGRIDVLTGGFPCQPYSMAGKRLGNEDERHLWPEMLRAIREIQPTWVVGENVLGLVNWNGGLVFDEVQAELEAQGYEVQPYVLPACSVNAPHRRDRVWFVAYARDLGHRGGNIEPGTDNSKERQMDSDIQQHGDGIRGEVEGRSSTASDTNSSRLQKERAKLETTRLTGSSVQRPTSNTSSEPSERVRSQQRELSKPKQGELGGNSCQVADNGNASNAECSGGGEILHDLQREQSNGSVAHTFNEQTNWQEFPTVSPVCDGDDGVSHRLDGITFPKWRSESVKAGGNAIVPQVALQIFKSIQQYENEH